MEATSNKKAAIILCSISLTMTVFIVLGFVYNATGFIYFMGINERALKIPLAWLCSIILAISYIAYTARMMPFVRENLFNFKGLLKWIGFTLGDCSGLFKSI